MDILLWIFLGGLAGWIASVVMKTANQSTMIDILLGMFGGIVGGFIMNLFGQPGVTGFNFYSLFVAVIGAIVVIYFGRALRR